MKNFAQSWLDIQCRQIEGLYSALVLLQGPNTNSLLPVAQSPINSRESIELIPIARIALEKKKQTINSSIQDKEVKDQCFDYLALPILSNSNPIGAVAIKIANCSAEELRNVIEKLEIGLKWLALNEEKSNSTSSFYSIVVKLVAACLEQDSYDKASTTLISHLSTYLGCERVSFGLVKQQFAEVTAFSNSARVDARSNLIKAISNAMDEAIDQDTIIIFPSSDKVKSYISRAHSELVRKFGCGSVCTIPMVHDGSVFAVITLERNEDRPFDPETVLLCEQTIALAAPFLYLKRQDEKGLGWKIWNSIKSRTSEIISLDQVGLKLTVMLFFFVICFASLVKTDFQVHADAIIEGKIQRQIAAALDGYIISANFRAGNLVKKGDILAKLDDRDLKLEQIKLSSQHRQILREYREAMAENDRVQVRILNSKIDQTKAELALVEEQLTRTRITAPFDAMIIDGDLSQSVGLPVERGDTLFKIAPLDDYRIILKVDEKNIAHVSIGQQGTLVLSSLPGKRHSLEVEKISTIAKAEDGQNAFRVEASLQGTPPLLRPGMEGVGKIRAGRETVMWIWTHELFDWLSLWIWSYLP